MHRTPVRRSHARRLTGAGGILGARQRRVVKPINVLVVDDQALFRAGVSALLRAVTGVKVLGEAVDGRDALRLLAKRQPDVILIDVSIPAPDGLGAAARIAQEYPAVGVVVLALRADEETLSQALKGGARGYLLKDADPDELELAVRTVAGGATYLSRAITNPAVAAPTTSEQRGPEDRLTARQREVLQLIAEGHTSRSIAERLQVSLKTVEAHRGRLMDRLGIRDVAGLVRWAIRHHLVDLEV